MVADVVFGIIAEENTALLICLSAPGTGPQLHVSSAWQPWTGSGSASPEPCLGS